MKITKQYLKDLVYRVNGAAIEVHRQLGPGLTERVYHECLKQELKLRGIKFKSEMIVPIHYKGLDLDAKLRCDLFIEDVLVVELKSVKEVLPIHEAQLITYMKLLKSPEGLMLNFNVTHIFKEGQKTFVNEYFTRLPDY